MSKTILVVDDSPTMVIHLSAVLHDAGYSVVTALHGREALDHLDAGLRPALILTDLNMPVMDGIRFITEARRLPAARFVPIVVLTSEESKEAEARTAGASGWLTKPLQPNTLVKTLQHLLPP